MSVFFFILFQGRVIFVHHQVYIKENTNENGGSKNAQKYPKFLDKYIRNHYHGYSLEILKPTIYPENMFFTVVISWPNKIYLK